jgi:hypothetical protein
MLRNLNRVTSGKRVLGTRLIGTRGDQIPSAGTHGPGAGYDALSLPAQNAVLVRFEVTSLPASGVLQMFEDTGFTLAGAADGTWALVGNEFFDNVLYGEVTHSIVIGAGAPGDVSTPGSLITMTVSMLGGGAAVDAVTPGSLIVIGERLVSSYVSSLAPARPLIVSPGRMMCR